MPRRKPPEVLDPDAPPPPPEVLVPGVARALSPLVRRIVAPNPGMMTGPGTNTYLVGIDEIAVIDPGPDDASHLDAVTGCGGDRIRWILCTHTHPDHSPGAAALKAATGAEVLAFAHEGMVLSFSQPGTYRVAIDPPARAQIDAAIEWVRTLERVADAGELATILTPKHVHAPGDHAR